ncbi:DUF4405 domain-containing protein [Oleispirillum naphthae]|uniref:DUF4405 domain-containing protein n=1 Tax=Oleispirillum naphthae TaxID=2838853 RepID=UPI003B66DEAA
MYRWKRPVALVLLAATLVLAVTGVWLWLGYPPGSGGGYGRGGASSMRHTLRDIHLYASWAAMPATVLHIACNWRAMLRHLGFGGGDGTRNPASPDTPRRR